MVVAVEATEKHVTAYPGKHPDPASTSRNRLPSRSERSPPNMTNISKLRTPLSWVLAAATTAGLALVAAPPAQAKTLYVRANTALVAAATPGARAVRSISPGSALRSAGVRRAGFTKVRWHGTSLWVRSKYATASLGSRSLNKLRFRPKVAVLKVRYLFPRIRHIGGWRSWSFYSSDHRNGRAVDFMVPSYRSSRGKKLGSSLAHYLTAHSRQLHVSYVIWRQRIWTRDSRKWRHMANRGSANANHMNHVHASFTKH